MCALPWILLICKTAAFVPRHPQWKTSSSILGAKENPEDLIEKAKNLRKDVESFEAQKKAAEDALRKQADAERAQRQEIRERYSAVVPILKGDGSTQMERCDFTPRWKEGSRILVVEANLPVGVILGESEQFAGTTAVDEVAEGSNGAVAGLEVGDLIRALTATKVEMEMPTWQLMAGGIGVPKTKRFMYSADGRPFEEVLEAVASNRQDPEGRPVLFVIERKE